MHFFISSLDSMHTRFMSKCDRLLPSILAKQVLRHDHSFTSQGTQVVDTQFVAGEFQKCYTSLYNIPFTFSSVGNRHILLWYRCSCGNLLSPISFGIIEELERLTTAEKQSIVIAGLPLCKSPGPDGFTNRYYKKFLLILAKPLCHYFNSTIISYPLPVEVLLAHITLPKPGEDPQYC